MIELESKRDAVFQDHCLHHCQIRNGIARTVVVYSMEMVEYKDGMNSKQKNSVLERLCERLVFVSLPLHTYHLHLVQSNLQNYAH